MSKALETELRRYLSWIYYQEDMEESPELKAAHNELKKQINNLDIPFKIGDTIVSKAIEISSICFDDGFIAGYKHALLMLGLTDKKESL